MSSSALYRKYRPDSFDTVVGQKNAVSTLKESIRNKSPSHAYIFFGGRGTGKTSLARIFARDLGVDPIDIIELDAASNRGIDEIRELKENVSLLPFSSPYKVYILDEAHMLTREAANALLKTLEEPPSHVLFILATTDPDKLPDTILSRCQQIPFEIPGEEALAKHLISIAKSEGVTLEGNGATHLAKEGKGSFRDSLVLLERALLYAEKGSLTKGIVEELLGVPQSEVLFSLAKALVTKDAAAATKILNDAEKKGVKAKALYEALLETLREHLRRRALGEKSDGENLVVTSNLIAQLLRDYTLFDVHTGNDYLILLVIILSSIETK